MAELPDLAVFAATLNRKFATKTVKEIEVKVAKKLNVTVAELKSAIADKKLNSVARYGKTLRFYFSGENVLGLHLMLRGDLVAIDKTYQPTKSTILYLLFSGGEGFAVVDPLKQATPTLNPPEAKSPDALDMELAYFTKTLSKRKKAIKEVLMDQQLMRGIGNAYADEILWDAKISPFSAANAIPEPAVKQLFKSISTVLEQAIKDLTKSSGDDFKGELRDFMKVYGPKIEKSPTGAKVKSDKIAGRSTYFTDEQKLYE